MTSQEQSYGNSFIWTLFLVAIFIGLQYVPLPFVDSVFENVNKTNGISRFNIVALGLMPVVSAFSITEFFSFLVSPLSAWRMAGIAGRDKLNLVAWGLSLVFAFIQGLGSGYLILSFVKSDLSLYFWGPTIIFQLVVVSGLMAGTFLCVWIAQLITRYGVGNGFLIIFFAEFIQSFIHHLIKRSSSLAKLNLLFDQRVSIFFIAVVLIGAAIFLWKFIRRALTVPIKLNNDSLLRFEISPFPMGVTATGFGLSIITAIDQLLRYVESDFYPSAAVFFDSAYKVINDGWTCIAFECVFIVLLGRVFFSLFYSEIDFFGLEVESLPNHLRKNKKVLNKQFMKGLGVMVVGTALFLIPLDEKVGSVFSLVGFSTLVFSIAIIQDLWTQWKFWRFNGTGIEVLEMDNVHLSSYLNGLFKTEGITFYIQSYRYRQILFWFAPMIKMKLFVSAEDVAKANNLIATVKYQVV